MSNAITATTAIFEIIDDTDLADTNTTACVDERGDLTLIEDESLPEDKQTFVSLSAEKVRALIQFLSQPNIASLYTTH